MRRTSKMGMETRGTATATTAIGARAEIAVGIGIADKIGTAGERIRTVIEITASIDEHRSAIAAIACRGATTRATA